MPTRFLIIIVALSILLSGCINSNNRLEEKSIKSDTQNKSSNDNINVSFDYDYATMEEAEEKLIMVLDVKNEKVGHIYDNYIYNEEFVDFVLKEPKTIDYPFDKLQEKEYVNIVTSEDGNLRLYYWDNCSGGTMIIWSNICQYRSNGNVYAYEGSIKNVKYNIPDDNNREEDDYDIGCAVLGIKTIYTYSGEPVYLVNTYIRESSNWGYYSIEAIKIDNDKLVSVPIFPKNMECLEEDVIEQMVEKCYLGYEHTIPDWYFRANNGEGWNWMFMYNDKSETLYVPYIDNCSITDRYEMYRYDGEYMNYIGIDGGFWLHPSLRSFMSLEIIFDTKKYRVRIDKMYDDTYRYASWSDGNTMDKLPDIILYNGYYDKTNLRYCFTQNDYKYYVENDNRLIVTRKGKEILVQERVCDILE